jgi:heterodisulfide reductase subunit A
MAAKAEIAALEKKAKKARKTLDKFEENFGESSSEFFKRYEGGEYEGDEDRKKWADRYTQYLAVAEPLEALKEKAKGFTVAKKLAFIQCVGSRDLRFYPFCSGYCCMHSIKEAVIAYEHEPETRSVIFGMDIRAVGKGFEEYKIRGGNQAGISYVRGRVAEITEGPDRNPVLTYEDTRERVVKSEAFDLVILATACVPSKGISALAEILGIELDEFGFYKTDTSQPMDTTRPGIFTCGCAHSPMDIPESVAQASGAAARAAQILLESEMRKAS